MPINGGIRYQFVGKSSAVTDASSHCLTQRSFNEACDFLRDNTLGSSLVIQSPFGNRRLLYADYTASGRSLKCIEEYIQNEVLPFYGNTHTLSSATGSQTTFFRIEARQIIKQYLNATHEDALIFCGSGSTAAVQKFIAIMQGSMWNVSTSQVFSDFSNRDGDEFFREDRWGSCECTLCGIRLKNEHLYRAHQHSDGHQYRLAEFNNKTSVVTTEVANAKESSEPVKKTETPSSQDAPVDTASRTSVIQRLVVFICDPSAHHSSSLPFRELVKSPQPIAGSVARSIDASQSDTVYVSFDLVELNIDPVSCKFDRKQLEHKLICYQLLQQKVFQIQQSVLKDLPKDESTLSPSSYRFEVVPIAILSAGSNVTGLQADVPEISELIHQYGGIACWDFAAVSAHTKIDINPPDRSAAAIDVGFFSPHKLLGGPGCPGMLVIKKLLLRNSVPSVPGGGVVFYVSRDAQSYIHVSKNAEEREEGGTPDILADIRTGLTYRLHSQLSPHHIAMREFGFVEYLIRNWGKHKRIQLLGPLGINPSPSTPSEHLSARMGIIPFMIKYGNDLSELVDSTLPKQDSVPQLRQTCVQGGLYLHHHFVVALLNDLFGIQVRGGCLCAGPLSQFLLGLDEQKTKEFEECLERTGQEVFRPGFIRASIHYSMSWDDIEVLCQAVLWVADFGWKLLPAYTFVPETGEWEHRVTKPESCRRWLSTLSLVKTPGVGMTATVSGRVGRQDHTEKAQEDVHVVLPKKDPRRIAGAVALLPGATDGNKDVFRMNL